MHEKSARSSGRETGYWLCAYTAARPRNQERKYLNRPSTAAADVRKLISTRCSVSETSAKLDSSKQTLNTPGYCLSFVRSAVAPKEPQGLRGLLRRYVAPRLGPKALASISSLDIRALLRDLLVRNLSARSIRYTHGGFAVGVEAG